VLANSLYFQLSTQFSLSISYGLNKTWRDCGVWNAVAEPGYYQDGEFGIRIENLVLLVEANTPVGLCMMPYAKRV